MREPNLEVASPVSIQDVWASAPDVRKCPRYAPIGRAAGRRTTWHSGPPICRSP